MQEQDEKTNSLIQDHGSQQILSMLEVQNSVYGSLEDSNRSASRGVFFEFNLF